MPSGDREPFSEEERFSAKAAVAGNWSATNAKIYANAGSKAGISLEDVFGENRGPKRMKPHAATSKTWQGYVVQAVREVAASRRADDEAKELGRSVSGFGGKQITPEQVTQGINKAREALERRKTELQAKRRKSVSG